MRFWTREIVGWVLVALGLFGFYLCTTLIFSPYFLEAGAMTVISIVVFRGGIHLVKVAVAARICQQAQEHFRETGPALAPAAPPKVAARRITPGAPLR